MHPNVHCSIICSSQVTEATQVPINRLVDKNVVKHIYKGILLSHKKEQNLTLCDSMNGPSSSMLNEMSLSKKDKYHMIF